MFDKWLKIPAHYWLRVTALVLLIVGVAVSNVLMSIGAIWIISNWLIEADFKLYKERLFSNLPLIFILLFIVYSIISIAWSDDFWYAFHDLRIKLPLIAIPIALGSGKILDKKIFNFLLILFVLVVCLTSLINYYWYHFLNDFQDIRKMSWFISHIRFAILVNLAFVVVIYLWYIKTFKWYFALPLILWFTYYTFIAQVVNGYILFIALSVFTIIYLVQNSLALKWRILSFASIIISIVVVIYQVNNHVQNRNKLDEIHFSKLDFYTVNGRPYYHDTITKTTENGHYIWLYVSTEELKKEWNTRSQIPYDSLDKKGQPMYGTAMRYLTSKNFRKDSVGVWSLSDAEIKAIENGQTNVDMNRGAVFKFNQFLEEIDLYNAGLDPNGSSTLQRIEHFKTALHILKSYWLTGVGIGDVNTQFQNAYNECKSQLTSENRLRSHNQFLTAWIGLGLIGFLIMIGWFIVPLFNKANHNYLSLAVLIILFISFLFEDMLETQAGATIFAVFYSLTILIPNPNSSKQDDLQG